MTEQPNRRSVLSGALAIGAGGLLPSVAASAPLWTDAKTSPDRRLFGVNLAGADFGPMLGQHGREYLYPTLANIRYYRDLGFNVIRLPFKWERLQPDLGAPFAAEEQRLLTECVAAILDADMAVILDPHNYAKRRLSADNWQKEHVIGTAGAPAESFADLWRRLAALFRSDQRVIFGLMNEPVHITAANWLAAANLAIAAIRQGGADNLILVPGVEYSGAHSWLRVGNDIMAGVVDPAKRFAFEVHQYFDGNSSGTSPEAVSATIGSERIKAFEGWARQHGAKAFLGEFNGGRNDTSYQALDDICRHMAAHDDVWLGWAAWAGGPRWPEDDMFNLEPWSDGRIREQTKILAKHAAGSD